MVDGRARRHVWIASVGFWKKNGGSRVGIGAHLARVRRVVAADAVDAAHRELLIAAAMGMVDSGAAKRTLPGLSPPAAGAQPAAATAPAAAEVFSNRRREIFMRGPATSSCEPT